MKILEQLRFAIAEEKENLIRLSKSIQQNPELGGSEYFASKLLCDYLEEQGFDVQRGVGEFETAFVASYQRGEGGFHAAFCAEYDALPDVGHACGHNLIGVASVAAGVALSKVDIDLPCKITVIGTHDEEGIGGKIDLINEGIFDKVDMAMMFHPGYDTIIDVKSLAFKSFDFIFHGQNAHAASEPWLGRNALDGVSLTFHAVNCLRQHVKPDVRIHGIIKEGGKVTNVVPHRAVAEFCIRSEDNVYLQEVVDRVIDCAKGAAISSGTELEIQQVGHPYDAMVSNQALVELFKQSLDDLDFVNLAKHKEGMGSIDMGNVSRVVPSIHPVLSLTDQLVPGHTKEFADLCNSDKAYETMLLAGEAMALTTWHVLQDPKLQKKIKDEFAHSFAHA
ncbi:M20 family metallopeptidase [Falsibacillus albus]|uniref:Peptidase M20 domain-containing protein 2 n=1 Tax=Falsibacillus albus TaxID=2478915 RepID=A0A3L7JWT8_9BACI|nr:M20 family metallopeptidase [Falsibacillus albus]RLQ94785.1 M20 family peptidase [Falsibacillus albus]